MYSNALVGGSWCTQAGPRRWAKMPDVRDGAWLGAQGPDGTQTWPLARHGG